MRSLLLLIALAGACGDDGGNKTIDAPGTTGDTNPMIDAPPGGNPDCASYCTAIMTNCTAGNSQYSSAADCMNSCSKFMLGTLNQMTTNTVGCRLYHAQAAATGATLHCPHAGPGGDATCGTICEGYCTIAVAVCPTQAGNMQTCMTDCAGYGNAAGKYNSAIQSGDTKECRLYHATAASTAPGAHCPHVGDNSTTCQ